MAIKPLSQKPSPNQAPEIRVRDMRETAAKASKDRAQAKLKDESESRMHEGERLRDEQRTQNVDSKKAERKTAIDRQERTDQENRRIEEKKNPNAGNIINVIA
jgi:hypothetical protein